jgi:hypothetical protein
MPEMPPLKGGFFVVFKMEGKMEPKTKMLALRAIDENCESAGSKIVVEWVMDHELGNQDGVALDRYLFNKNIKDKNMIEDLIKSAVESSFISITGSGASRTFELNLQFLKGKMAEIVAREAVGKIDANVLSDLIDSSGIRDL